MGERLQLKGLDWLAYGAHLCLMVVARPALAAVVLPYPPGPWNETHTLAVAG